jgi:hypothetical protein
MFEIKMSSSLFNSTNKNSSIVPKYAMYFNITKFELKLPIFFVKVEYIAHKKGVRSANKYPKKFGSFGVRVFRLPPVIRRNPPSDATINPNIFLKFSFSLKNIKAKIVMTTGANKHTNKAGNEGPIISIAEY